MMINLWIISLFILVHSDELKENENGDLYFYRDYEFYVDFHYNVDPTKSATGSFTQNLKVDNNFYVLQIIDKDNESSDEGILYQSKDISNNIILESNILGKYIRTDASKDFTIIRSLLYQPRQQPKNNGSTSFCYHYHCVPNKHCRNPSFQVGDSCCEIYDDNTYQVNGTSRKIRNFLSDNRYQESTICRMKGGGTKYCSLD